MSHMQLALVPGEEARGQTFTFRQTLPPRPQAPRPRGPGEPAPLGVYFSYDDHMVISVMSTNGTSSTAHVFPLTVALTRGGTPYVSEDADAVEFRGLKARLDDAAGEWIARSPRFPEREYPVVELLACCVQSAHKKLLLLLASEGQFPVVSCVPCFWADRQRQAVKHLLQKHTRFSVKRIINEEIATGIAYGIDRMEPRQDQECFRAFVLRCDASHGGAAQLICEDGIFEIFDSSPLDFSALDACTEQLDMVCVFGTAPASSYPGLHARLLDMCGEVRGIHAPPWSPASHRLYRDAAFRREVAAFLLVLQRLRAGLSKDLQRYIISILAQLHRFWATGDNRDPRTVASRGAVLQANILSGYNRDNHYQFCIG